MSYIGKYFQQTVKELDPFCEFLKDKGISSYVEVGVYRGQMLNYMKRRFGLSRCYGADINSIPLPDKKSEFEPLLDGIVMFVGNVHTWEYVSWRKKIGEVDLVFIDASHDAAAVFWDLTVEYSLGLSRFVGMHDVGGWPGPRMAWNWIDDDMKLFYRDAGEGMGIGLLKGPRECGYLRVKK